MINILLTIENVSLLTFVSAKTMERNRIKDFSETFPKYIIIFYIYLLVVVV